jgi:hypothetical protein
MIKRLAVAFGITTCLATMPLPCASLDTLIGEEKEAQKYASLRKRSPKLISPLFFKKVSTFKPKPILHRQKKTVFHSKNLIMGSVPRRQQKTAMQPKSFIDWSALHRRRLAAVKKHQRETAALHQQRRADLKKHQRETAALHQQRRADLRKHQLETAALHQQRRADLGKHQRETAALHQQRLADLRKNQRKTIVLRQQRFADLAKRRLERSIFHQKWNTVLTKQRVKLSVLQQHWRAVLARQELKLSALRRSWLTTAKNKRERIVERWPFVSTLRSSSTPTTNSAPRLTPPVTVQTIITETFVPLSKTQATIIEPVLQKIRPLEAFPFVGRKDESLPSRYNDALHIASKIEALPTAPIIAIMEATTVSETRVVPPVVEEPTLSISEAPLVLTGPTEVPSVTPVIAGMLAKIETPLAAPLIAVMKETVAPGIHVAPAVVEDPAPSTSETHLALTGPTEGASVTPVIEGVSDPKIPLYQDSSDDESAPSDLLPGEEARSTGPGMWKIELTPERAERVNKLRNLLTRAGMPVDEVALAKAKDQQIDEIIGILTLKENARLKAERKATEDRQKEDLEAAAEEKVRAQALAEDLARQRKATEYRQKEDLEAAAEENAFGPDSLLPGQYSFKNKQGEREVRWLPGTEDRARSYQMLTDHEGVVFPSLLPQTVRRTPNLHETPTPTLSPEALRMVLSNIEEADARQKALREKEEALFSPAPQLPAKERKPAEEDNDWDLVNAAGWTPRPSPALMPSMNKNAVVGTPRPSPSPMLSRNPNEGGVTPSPSPSPAPSHGLLGLGWLGL